MPAQLNPILATLLDRGMDDVLLQDGQRIVLRQGTRRFAANASELSRAQILRLVAELVPPDAQESLDQAGVNGGTPLHAVYVLPDGREVAIAVGAEPVTADASVADAGAPTGSSVDPAASDATAAWSVRITAAHPPEPIAIGAPIPDGARLPYNKLHHPRRRESDNPWGPFADETAARSEMERLLRTQVEVGAADLHLRVGERPILRVSGDLRRMEGEESLDNDRLTAMILSLMEPHTRREFQDNADTDFAYEIAGVSRFRGNALRERRGSAAVFRTIAAGTVSVDDMGISKEVQQLCYLPKGLVLVTGPTGSGKSTTLCALIDLINRTRSDHIITIEDPIEFVHTSRNCLITQRQVGMHTKSFKSALRAALREDPDIVLVGELRDLETVAIAIETAETGHLVFATLHTSTAAGTVDRIIDQFPADQQAQIRVMLAESLKGVVSQTLLKKKGGGRVAAREVMIVNSAVSNLIREGKTVQIASIMQTNKRLGMVLLNDALMELVDSGQVEPLDAYLKAADKASLAERLKAKGIDVLRLHNQAQADEKAQQERAA